MKKYSAYILDIIDILNSRGVEKYALFMNHSRGLYRLDLRYYGNRYGLIHPLFEWNIYFNYIIIEKSCVEDPHYLQKLSRNLRECEYEFSLNEYESLLCLFDLKDNHFREAKNCILHLQIKNKSQIVCAIVSHSMQNKTTKF